MNKFRRIVEDIKRQMRSNISPKRRRALMSAKEKLELWARMEEGDDDALMELSVRRGLMKRETAERLKKEAYDEKEEP